MDLRPVSLTVVLPAGLLVAALAACGPEPTDTQVSGPVTSPSATSAAPTVPGNPVEFRLVLASDLAPAPDSETRQRFENLDCGSEPVPVPPEEPLAACDDEGIGYVLEPASIVGGVESATATLLDASAAWAVTVDLDAEATRTFAEVSTEIVATMRQFAIVLDGRVLSAPTVNSPVLDGQLQVSGNFTEEEAQTLAARLAGE